MIVKCKNGAVIEIRESPYYFTVTIGGGTWYWNIDTGKFDGWGETRLSSSPSPIPLPIPRLRNHQLV